MSGGNLAVRPRGASRDETPGEGRTDGAENQIGARFECVCAKPCLRRSPSGANDDAQARSLIADRNRALGARVDERVDEARARDSASRVDDRDELMSEAHQQGSGRCVV